MVANCHAYGERYQYPIKVKLVGIIFLDTQLRVNPVGTIPNSLKACLELCHFNDIILSNSEEKYNIVSLSQLSLCKTYRKNAPTAATDE